MSLSIQLSDEETLFLFDVMTGENKFDPKETTLKLQNILSSIRPEFSKQISALGRELASSVYDQIRQAHLLMRPLANQFSQVTMLHSALQKLEQDITTTEAQNIFDLIHTPAYRQPQAQIENLQKILIRIYPSAGNSVNLSDFVKILSKA